MNWWLITYPAFFYLSSPSWLLWSFLLLLACCFSQPCWYWLSVLLSVSSASLRPQVKPCWTSWSSSIWAIHFLCPLQKRSQPLSFNTLLGGLNITSRWSIFTTLQTSLLYKVNYYATYMCNSVNVLSNIQLNHCNIVLDCNVLVW